MGHDTVKDDGEARRKEEADRASRSNKAKSEILGVAALQEDREQEGTKGEYRHTRCPGKRAEKSTGERGGDCRTTRQPPKPGAKESHQPGTGGTFGEQIAGEGEQGD